MKKLFLLLLTFASLNTYAQYRDLYFEHLNVANGLPESFVEALHQDKLGYIWISTQNGLVRYDGYQLKIYKLGHEEKNSPKDFGISDIFEDKNGVLWFCARTKNVYRYNMDNDSFQQYHLGDNSLNSHFSNFLGRLIGDDSNNLWVYSKYFSQMVLAHQYNHLQQLNTVTGSVTTFPYIVTSAVKIKSGRIWFGTDKGLVYYNHSTDKMSGAFMPAVGIGMNTEVVNLYEAPSDPGVLWFSLVDDNDKYLGLFSFDIQTRSFKRYSHNNGLPGSIASDTVYTIHEDSKKRLWFGTFRGLSLYDRKSGLFINYTPTGTGNSSGENPVSELVEQVDGKLWLATTNTVNDAYGLLLFDPSTDTFQRYEHDEKTPYSLNRNAVVQLMIDRTGILWVGMAWGGLDRINSLRSQFATWWPTTSDLNSYPGGAQGIAEGADGNCWIGSQEGLIRWKPNTQEFKRIHLPAYIKGEPVRVYTTDHEGLVWCSTNNVRIFTYNPKTEAVDTLNYPGKWPVNNNATILYQDHSGIIWIGTNRSGLYSYQKGSGKFKGYPYEEISPDLRYVGKKLDQSQVESIYEDNQGVLWIGTNLGGLNRFNRKDGTFKSYYDMSKGFSSITSIHEDKEGRFWVGTYLSGLFLFDRKTGNSRQFSEKDGLLYDEARKIFEDTNGKLWILSERGFTRMDPNRYDYTRFTTANALPFSFENQLLDQNSLETPDNQIIYAGPQALLAFYPERLTKNTYPPQIYIESLNHNDPQSSRDTERSEILFGKSQFQLPHNQNRITFNYVGLHYENPPQNKYEYQLTGYDKNWVQAGTQRTVTYTNLSPGTYSFRVKAANSDGVWNEKGASFTLIINPPWWHTWWAILIFIFIIVALLWGIIYYRSINLMRIKNQLEQKVQLRTQEVLEQKEEIAVQRDNLEHTLDELKTTQTQLVQREKMASLGELTAGIAHEIQNPLNFVNNFSEVSVELLNEMDEELDKGEIKEAKAIGADLKQNLEKISHHGKRADFIVKGMLEHSRTGTGERQLTNINVLADEFLKLSYHGLRAKDKAFNAGMITHFDKGQPEVSIVQKDIGQVLLNLFNNAFYAVNQKRKTADENYKPEVTVTTSLENNQVIIKVKDNGVGMPKQVKEKIMQPFFTTKPTGEGTGLGLSLTYDMVVKGHAGSIQVNSEEGLGSEFIISLPL